MKRFCAALGFLTILPLPAACRHTERDLIGSVIFFPLIGLVIGLSAAGTCFLLEDHLPPLVLSVVLVGWLAMVHGGLHLDGLADTADGFLSHHGRERVLAIMRDSHIGAFGALAMMGILALKTAALASLSPDYRLEAMLLAPLAGRAILAPLLLLPSARADGLGNLFYREGTDWRVMGASLGGVAGLLVVAGLATGPGLAAVGTVIMAIALFAYWCWRRIGGVTGDTLGAASELAEALVLLVLCL
uniref:Adenosylcobinamide-GDP ribazoletransferase n=1 Tax=Candidatus Kentrum sp. MB TaxID=2138164 RepID=A0A451B8T3_9GAMM|nr:MAG: cobalamin-5'-phosphate synthase [Candidatus Kentron sp. MB]VFK29096.1 MAG: cobalamin-5'-phosphate synthase [Candidatus Kentron sp. MB]VFK74672.1 MAG: cobalamin-5'-phosphate synthase [Candidatus Kentron sp. MB]